MNRIKRLMVAVLGLLAAPALYAQSASSSIDVGSSITDIQSGMTGLVSDLRTPLITVLLAGLFIWALPKIVRFFKSVFSASGGK